MFLKQFLDYYDAYYKIQSIKRIKILNYLEFRYNRIQYNTI